MEESAGFSEHKHCCYTCIHYIKTSIPSTQHENAMEVPELTYTTDTMGAFYSQLSSLLCCDFLLFCRQTDFFVFLIVFVLP